METEPAPSPHPASDAAPMPAEIKGWVEMTNEAYHEDTSAVSHSALECFRESPRLYQARYLSKTAPRKESSGFEFGTAFHCLMLEPDRFGKDYAVAPERWKQNTNVGKAALKAFEEKHAGATILWPEEFETLDKISKSAYADPAIAALLEAPGLVEAAFTWLEPESGVPVKCKPDKVLWFEGKLVVLDLKSTSNIIAHAFAYACGKFGYHRQDALYRDVVAGAAGIPAESVRFLFLACGKDEPCEARLFELDGEAVACGRDQNRADLASLATCRHFDMWPTPGSGEITRLSLPKYALGDS